MMHFLPEPALRERVPRDSPDALTGAASAGAVADRSYRQFSDLQFGPAPSSRPSVCIVTSEIVGPFRNGGVGTAMTGLAEHLAASGCAVTVLYTGSVWRPDVPLRAWQRRYEAAGIRLVALAIDGLAAFDGPLLRCGFAIPALVYRWLVATRFDVVHFNDCGGEGYLCVSAKRLGTAFHDTLLVVALHSPSQWTLELNRLLPSSLLLSASNHAERLSIRLADVLWSPSRYLLDWCRANGFELPPQTLVQQYCLPSARFAERSLAAEPSRGTPAYGRTAPPREVVFFGRLEERKGLRGFCDAVDVLQNELAERGVGVVFLGKADRCDGVGSRAYIARRSRDWRFPVSVLADSGQVEALAYLRAGNRLAVMPAPVDNSPCTVYEALALGIPFLASRGGGVPELVNEADHAAVLFDPTLAGLTAALRDALEHGGTVAREAQAPGDTRHNWLQFHAHASTFLPQAALCPETAPNVLAVLAVVDVAAGSDVARTLASLADVPAVRDIIVLHRGPLPPLSDAGVSVHTIDLSVDPPDALDTRLAFHDADVVLLIHGGVTVLADRFGAVLSAMRAPEVDGVVPAGQMVAGRARREVPPLGAHAPFALFEGTTFTGGLLVRRAALDGARRRHTPSPDAAFLGLADSCAVAGCRILPYPEVVFAGAEAAGTPGGALHPSRLEAFRECSAIDRHYMRAAAQATPAQRGGGRYRGAALTLVRAGLGPLVPAAARVVRRARAVRARIPLGRRLHRTSTPADTGLTMHVIIGLHGGGAERLLTNLVTLPASSRGRLLVVTLTPGGVFKRQVEAAGVELVDLGIARHPFDTLPGFRRLVSLLRARRPDVVQSWMYGANVFSWCALAWSGLRRTRGTRLIWGIFCSDMDTRAYHWSGLWLQRALARLLSTRVDGVVYNAARARDVHRAMGFREPRSLVIGNCVDPALFCHDANARRTVRAELGIADDAVMVISAARVDPMKNWDGLQAAVRDLPGVVTVAVGTNTERLPSQPGFIGLGWRDDVNRLFEASDIFVLNSAFGEGASLALSEAMWVGLPCVVTDVGGNGALLGDAGVVVPPKSDAALRDAIEDLARSPERRAQYGRAARLRTEHSNSAGEIARTVAAFVRGTGQP